MQVFGTHFVNTLQDRNYFISCFKLQILGLICCENEEVIGLKKCSDLKGKRLKEKQVEACEVSVEEREIY
jgi:hypothetical protein